MTKIGHVSSLSGVLSQPSRSILACPNNFPNSTKNSGNIPVQLGFVQRVLKLRAHACHSSSHRLLPHYHHRHSRRRWYSSFRCLQWPGQYCGRADLSNFGLVDYQLSAVEAGETSTVERWLVQILCQDISIFRPLPGEPRLLTLINAMILSYRHRSAMPLIIPGHCLAAYRTSPHIVRCGSERWLLHLKESKSS